MNIYKKKILGFTLIETLVSIGIAGATLLVILTILSQLTDLKARANFEITLGQLRFDFQQAVMRTPDWIKTVNNNPTMACFKGPMAASCLAQSFTPGAPWPFKLYTLDGNLIYDATSGTTGYRTDGTPCNTFPNGACVLKPILNWKMQCELTADPQCLSPLIIIDLSYQYVGANYGPINFNNYGFHLVNGTFPIVQTQPCGGVIPVCTASQAVLCVAGIWTCEEFGL